MNAVGARGVALAGGVCGGLGGFEGDFWLWTVKLIKERVCMWEISRIIDDPLVILKRKTPLGCAALRCEGSSG